MGAEDDAYARGYAEGVRVTREQQYRARDYLTSEIARLLAEHLGTDPQDTVDELINGLLADGDEY